MRNYSINTLGRFSNLNFGATVQEILNHQARELYDLELDTRLRLLAIHRNYCAGFFALPLGLQTSGNPPSPPSLFGELFGFEIC